MKFSELAKGLYTHCGRGKNRGDFVIELLGSIIDDDAKGECKILEASPSSTYKYFSGSRSFKPSDLTFITSALDKGKFCDWLSEFSPDVMMNISGLLTSWGVPNDGTDDDVTQKAADLFEDILLTTAGVGKNIGGASDVSISRNADGGELSYAFQKLQQIEDLIGELPKPKEVPVPAEITNDETVYINELLSAYADAADTTSLTKDDLADYPDYEEDLSGRRIDYFAAETVRRGVLELGEGRLSDQFEILKSETLTGVKDIERRRHENGYECMLAVMGQAALLPVTNYILSRSPYWISGKIKMGVCHVLVNDGKLKWVKVKVKKHE